MAVAIPWRLASIEEGVREGLAGRDVGGPLPARDGLDREVDDGAITVSFSCHEGGAHLALVVADVAGGHEGRG